MNEIFTRRSIRKFKETPVSKEKIEQILRAAMQAPSACNQRPWEFCVVTNKQTLNALSACSPYATCVKNAPLAVVVCSQKEGLRCPNYVNIDCSAATENILLECTSLGLGSVWLGISPEAERVKKVGKALVLPDTLKAFCIVAIGEPNEEVACSDRYETERVHLYE